ncbi:hypothetical protein [Natronobiforma cellulositropha]|uniref:hypothetical protein n=1 Tax=Natronobiforma cellulositropha TaxID=1679076 RepID=UPI0021D5C0A4|nr:hypothetical protein [Natronobiforma cellulositropha]
MSLLSSDGFEQSFGALYQQFRSHYDETVSQAVPLPAGVDPDSFILYMQDVTLEGEPEGRWRELAERLSARASETADRPSIRDLVTRTSRDAGEVFESLVNEYGDDLTASVPIESVSGLHVRYEDETGDEQTIWGDGRSGDADARIQLPPVPCNSLEQFREFLVLHLVCQLRDCYLGMGVEPPEPFRVLGIGIDDFTEKYRHFELYEPYYDPSATIPGYRDRPQWW